jgi:hypothetical protein
MTTVAQRTFFARPRPTAPAWPRPSCAAGHQGRSPLRRDRRRPAAGARRRTVGSETRGPRRRGNRTINTAEPSESQTTSHQAMPYRIAGYRGMATVVQFRVVACRFTILRADEAGGSTSAGRRRWRNARAAAVPVPSTVACQAEPGCMAIHDRRATRMRASTAWAGGAGSQTRMCGRRCLAGYGPRAAAAGSVTGGRHRGGCGIWSARGPRRVSGGRDRSGVPPSRWCLCSGAARTRLRSRGRRREPAVPGSHRR